MPALTPAKRRYIAVLIETGSTARAAKAASINTQNALADIAVQREVHTVLQAKLLAIAPKALHVLEKLMMDPDVPPAVRRLAASDILDRVGLISQSALQLSKPLESLSEMPARDLRALVERLETELFARAKPVRDLEFNATVVTPPSDKPLSILD